MSKYSFDAVVFDLDGVITRTATVHAKAWKLVFDEYLHLRERRNNEPFQPFTYEGDYLPFVDGKPRYDGVRSFLESRGISIPFGDPKDFPDKETICGIGNKKNLKFNELLRSGGVEVYLSSIEFIRALKKANIKIGIASSSKNCRGILQSANIEDLFETRVDGVVSTELGLKGKPEGDIFVTAVHNLGTIPAKSVVVEDAVSGQEAGRNGGFGLVLGIARKNNEKELLESGADIVVKDLSDIDIKSIERWFHKKPKLLFKFWNESKQLSNKKNKGKLIYNPHYFHNPKSVIFNSNSPMFFLDYDGTLTPIVDRPELAVLGEDMKEVLKQLSKRYTVAIVSGRLREDVQKLVGIENIFYAGSHGFDIVGPGVSMIEPRAKQLIPVIAEVSKRLSVELCSIPGILIEEKKFSVAVHYRLVDEKRYLGRIKDFVSAIIKENSNLKLMHGKKVFEILPKIDWDKGKAVRWIMQALKVSWEDVSVIYIGDDVTDEDAFRVVRTRGTAILVSNKTKESCADFRLTSHSEVKRFLVNFC